MNSQNLVHAPNDKSSSKLMLNLDNQQGFDYEILDQQTQMSVKRKASDIKGLIQKTAQNIVEVGQKLAEVKQQLKHGQFRIWLKSEFNWSVSSATKFMQVSEKFKNVNFTHYNFSISALYILAAPSTPESARRYAIDIASQGENITYSIAKLIVKHHRDSIKKDSYCSNRLNSATINQIDDQGASSVVDDAHEYVTKRPNKSVRILEIKQEKAQYIGDKTQDFEIIYAGTSIAVQGRPKDLTILFEKMQNHPQFAEDIFRQARLISE